MKPTTWLKKQQSQDCETLSHGKTVDFRSAKSIRQRKNHGITPQPLWSWKYYLTRFTNSSSQYKTSSNSTTLQMFLTKSFCRIPSFLEGLWHYAVLSVMFGSDAPPFHDPNRQPDCPRPYSTPTTEPIRILHTYLPDLDVNDQRLEPRFRTV